MSKDLIKEFDQVVSQIISKDGNMKEYPKLKWEIYQRHFGKEWVIRGCGFKKGEIAYGHGCIIPTSEKDIVKKLKIGAKMIYNIIEKARKNDNRIRTQATSR